MKVVLYTRDDCGLCEAAEEMLKRARTMIRFDLELVYIDNEDGLRERYGDLVPVVTVDGEEVAATPLDEASLLAALS